MRHVCSIDFLNACLLPSLEKKEGEKEKKSRSVRAGFPNCERYANPCSLNREFGVKGTNASERDIRDRICPIDGAEFRATSTTATYVVFTSLVCEARLCRAR